MEIPEGRIRVERQDIDFDQSLHTPHEPQRVTLYNIATLPQKIQLCLIVCLFFGFLITNLISIGSSFHLLPA